MPDVIIYCHRFHKQTNEYRLTYRIQWELCDPTTNETLLVFGWEQSFYAKEAKQRRWVAEILCHMRRDVRHKLLTHYAKLYQSPSYSQPSWQPPAALRPYPMPTYYEIQVRTPHGWSNAAADILPGLPQSANRWKSEEHALSSIFSIVFTTGRSRSDYRIIPIQSLAPMTPWPTDF